LGGVNQQERLSITEAKKWFLAGFIEGEVSLVVSIKEHPSAKFGYYVDPEFFIYQHKNGKSILELAKKIFQTGKIRPKSDNKDVLVFSITNRRSIKEKVIPFLKKYMVFSAKKKIIDIFEEIIEAMEVRKEHQTRDGLISIVRKAYAMSENSKGKERKRELKEVIDRILRDHMPDIS